MYSRTRVMEIGMEFGQELRNLRLHRGLSQAELARAANLEPSFIETLEAGGQAPWPSTRRALAGALRLSVEEFDARTMGSGMGAIALKPPSSAVADSQSDSMKRSWGTRESSASAPSSTAGGTSQFGYAPGKVMELLNQLGQAEHQLRQYQTFVDQVCAACWTTDAGLHIMSWFGPAAAEHRARHGEFRGRHISEFFSLAWGEPDADFLPLVMQQRAADGSSVSFAFEVNDARYMVFVDPLRDSSGKIIGTVGVAFDITYRETANT